MATKTGKKPCKSLQKVYAQRRIQKRRRLGKRLEKQSKKILAHANAFQIQAQNIASQQSFVGSVEGLGGELVHYFFGFHPEHVINYLREASIVLDKNKILNIQKI